MDIITVRDHNSRFPFTSTQWQELEHQALVYKYMISGMPIPYDLLISIKTSLDSSTKLIQFPHQLFGWDCFQMGFGRKIDPEPGRCRRTDGKKWRCSKEAFGDSKYCERHMRRGRNRSRKPVEANTPSSICTKLRSPGNVLSSQDRFLMESSPSETDISSGTISASVGDSWLLEPLVVNNLSASLADYQKNDHSYVQLQNSPTRQKQEEGCCNHQLALKIEGKDEAHKVMHHFFDESPHDDHNKDKDYPTTQLSISIPTCGHDFFLTRNDK